MRWRACRLQFVPALEHLVPEQAGEQEADRDVLACAHALVGARQRQHHEALALRLLEDHVEQRQQPVVQPLGAQAQDAGHRVPAGQQLQHLVEYARRRHVLEQAGQPRDRRARRLVDLEAELGGEAHRAQHPHRILAVARLRIADHAQPAALDVLHAVVIVDHRFGGRVVVKGVDREVAPRRIVGLIAEDVVGEHAAVRVDRLRAVGRGAVGRHLDRLRAKHHVHQPEAAADDDGAAEMRLDLLGRGVGGDVEVLRRHADQQVAHGAADDVGMVPGLLQRLAHPQRRAWHPVALDAVLGDRHLSRLVRAPAPREQRLHFLDKALDHRALPAASVGSRWCRKGVVTLITGGFYVSSAASHCRTSGKVSDRLCDRPKQSSASSAAASVRMSRGRWVSR